jgi:hypothetical protein
VRSADTTHPDAVPSHTTTPTVWASDVSAALSHDVAPSPSHPPIRVFPGSGDSKEYHF